MGSTRVWIGGIASILYALALVVTAAMRWHELRDLDLNELGDFLAGAFGPLAILWLVLGYFQQGEELRQNTAALHLQAEELRQSVAQQEQLVLITREQLEDERSRAKAKFLPSLRLRARNEESFYGVVAWILEVYNYGAPCSDLESVVSCTSWNLQEPTVERLEPGKPWQMQFLPIEGRLPKIEQFSIEITGVTAGNQAFKAFGLLEFTVKDGSLFLRVETYRPEIDIGE